MKKLLSWILNIFATHIVSQLITISAFAYFAGWIVAARNGVEVVLSNIPPLFLPITAGLAITVLFYPAFIAPIVKWNKNKEKVLRASIESAYIKFRNVCEPKTLNPAHPGNQNFMAADARDYANMISPLLEDADLGPPKKCTTTPESLEEWFSYLEEVRAMDRWIDLTYQAGGSTTN